MKIDEFKIEINNEILKRKYLINKYQSQLLLNKSYEFKLKPITDENNFGDLVTKNNKFPKNDRLNGIINS